DYYCQSADSSGNLRVF
nr:immunoglobulin light chain junction region [Macaca mulatta]